MNEHPNPRLSKTQAVTARLLEATTVAPARTIADEVFAEKDSALKMSLLSRAATINPFSVPHLPPPVQPASIFTVDAWAKSIAMARMVAANTSSKRILVASAPKTGSTFIAGALERAYGLSRASPTMLSALSYVAGRGVKITGRNRQKIEDFVHRFKPACDLTDLIEG